MGKILIQMNCDGYRWYEVATPSGSGKEICIRPQKYPDHPIVGDMRFYDGYDLLFIQDNGETILSINNILEENRFDPIENRPIERKLIFVGKDCNILRKLLFVYLSYPTDFSKWISKCFVPVDDTPECDLQILNETLSRISGLDIISNGIVGKELICSQQEVNWLMKNFKFSIERIKKFRMDINDILGKSKYIDNPFETEKDNSSSSNMPVDDEIKNLKDRIINMSNDLDEKIKELEASNEELSNTKKELDRVKDELRKASTGNGDSDSNPQHQNKWKHIAVLATVIAVASILYAIFK